MLAFLPLERGVAGFARRLNDGSPDSREAPQTRTILLVDDNHSERSVIRAAIETRTSFRVCGEAPDGALAIERAKELKPDLIIMDLSMPMMTGLEAAAVLKNEMPSVPVVLFTLYAHLVHGPRSPMFGITAVLSKEDGLTPLLHCLERLLGPAPSV